MEITSDPEILTAAQLRTYGGSRIILENNTLIYDKGVQLILIPLSNDEFMLRDKPEICLKFSEDRKQMNEVVISGKKRTFYKDWYLISVSQKSLSNDQKAFLINLWQ